jgi:transketolase
MIRNENDTIYMTVDLGMWAIRDVLRDYPERAMNIGIYEDGLMSIAAGMASRGFVPTIFGIQPYILDRTIEQLKMDFTYPKLGANIVGTCAAVDATKYGYSHYCPEDVGLIKQFPGAEFVAPGTAKQFLQLFNVAYRDGHPTFFRISDHPNIEYDVDVSFGKAEVIQKGSKATVIAVSVTLDDVMKVCAGEDVTVLYYTTLEPFDYATLAAHCPHGRMLVCEPHFSGSLDNDIVKALEGQSVKIAHIGFPHEIFRNYGTYREKLSFYGLTAENIHIQLENLLS